MKLITRTVAAAAIVALVSLTGAAGSAVAGPRDDGPQQRNIWCC
jgi:hypothetical protein